ncbi:MAG: hypothetical protein ACJAVI_004605 [Candidatus Azotimanducaceae bacterium]|jgi:hypothetical protein
MADADYNLGFLTTYIMLPVIIASPLVGEIFSPDAVPQ